MTGTKEETERREQLTLLTEEQKVQKIVDLEYLSTEWFATYAGTIRRQLLEDHLRVGFDKLIIQDPRDLKSAYARIRVDEEPAGVVFPFARTAQLGGPINWEMPIYQALESVLRMNGYSVTEGFNYADSVTSAEFKTPEGVNADELLTALEKREMEND